MSNERKVGPVSIIVSAVAIICVAGLGAFFLSKDVRRSVEIAAVDKMGDLAVERMKKVATDDGGVAAEFIEIKIGAREISPGIFQATGVGNAHLITTPAGNVLFDTGLATQVPKQIKALKEAIADQPLTHIIVSHSHADHSGGIKFWKEEATEIVAHQEFEEEQRYLTELQPYFWDRNRTLFPFMPEKPPSIGLIAYGGIAPTQTIGDGDVMRFEQGGVKFEVMGTPGAEGADNIVLWLPEKKILFSGDFFGPLFPQFPNVFTMRGEKIRKPIEYIASLNKIISLEPKMIVPSHLDPITDEEMIKEGLVRMRDAVQYIHDETVKGMNAGRTVEDLMAEIKLPSNLALSQQHGRVSWAVKSIWEYYATWFHFDKTTELYAIPAAAIYSDLVELTGMSALIDRANDYVEADEPLKALHLLEIVLEEDPNNQNGLRIRKKALTILLEEAESSLKNSYEIYWLNYRIRNVEERLSEQTIID